MAMDKDLDRGFKVYHRGSVEIYGKYVGVIDRDTYSTMPLTKPVVFKTASGDVYKTGYDTPHEINVPLFVGGGADWEYNEAFIQQVEEILRKEGKLV